MTMPTSERVAWWIWLLGRIGRAYMWLVWLTGRWEIRGDPETLARVARGDGYLMSFWHGRMLMLAFARPRAHTVNMLASANRDGDIILEVMYGFNVAAIRGSSRNPKKLDQDKGGAAATRLMVLALRRGRIVGITPDGPRGPRMRATEGLVAVARLGGQPIAPVSYSARWRKVYKSWDRFIVPLPFTRGVMIWGPLINVPRDLSDADAERTRIRIEETLNALTAEADREMGHTPIAPADEGR